MEPNFGGLLREVVGFGSYLEYRYGRSFGSQIKDQYREVVGYLYIYYITSELIYYLVQFRQMFGLEYLLILPDSGKQVYTFGMPASGTQWLGFWIPLPRKKSAKSSKFTVDIKFADQPIL